MKKVLMSFALLSLCLSARATTVVWDPGLAAQNAGNEVVNFAKWAKTELDAANTELNTLHQYETEILQLARMGDPAALRALPGISTLAQLQSVAGQLQSTYAAWKSFANPQYFQTDMNSILSAYGRPKWNGFTTVNGTQIYPSQSLYQFDTARWNIANQAEQQLTKLEEQRTQLEQQRGTVLQQIQSASDQSTVQKLHAALDGMNASLAELGARESGIQQETALKTQQANAAQQVSQRAQAEQQHAATLQSADQDYRTMLELKPLFTPMHFGGRP